MQVFLCIYGLNVQKSLLGRMRIPACIPKDRFSVS